MPSLPYSAAFDLCGEEPSALRRRLGAREALEPPELRSQRGEELAKIVEGEIIPRLMLAHSGRAQDEPATLGSETTEKFALYALSSPRDSLLAIIGGLLQNGVSLEAIYLDLLGPAARRLGEFWLEDRASFADVTIALGRLQQVVRELSLHGPIEGVVMNVGRSALFAPAQGEQHTFGLVIIEEFFRRAGWRTWSELSGQPEEVLAAVRAHHFDLFGLTASGDDRLEHIVPLIKSIRRESRNREISVLVGGRLFLDRPDFVAVVGADGAAADAREAVLKAEGAVRRLARH